MAMTDLLVAVANPCAMGFCHIFWCTRGKEGSIVLHVSHLLVSLRNYQRDKFKLSVEYIGELHELTILANVKAHKYKLLFVSPESLIHNSLWREVLSSKLSHLKQLLLMKHLFLILFYWTILGANSTSILNTSTSLTTLQFLYFIPSLQAQHDSIANVSVCWLQFIYWRQHPCNQNSLNHAKQLTHSMHRILALFPRHFL